MEALNDGIAWINEWLWYVVIALLIGIGVYLTVRSAGVQVRLLPEMFRIIGEKPGRSEDGEPGISAFRAFCISAASRVGTGNIAGVAIAISVGGPGAIFWMWALAVVGSATAFVESTLGQLFKVKDKQSFRGGPAYYMERGLKMRWMGVLFAVIISITYGLVFNSLQSNSITDAAATSLNIDLQTGGGAFKVAMGLLLAVLTAAVIFGGIRRISAISALVVPVMAVLYMILGLIVVALNITEVPAVFMLIIENAFGIQEIVGGGVGAALMQGIRRGLFSNEAGMGSVPNAAATASVSHPAKQGLIQSLGVYFDTLLVCSVTAFIVLLSDPAYGETQGASLTQTALAAQVGDWAVHFLTIAIFLFAFSSVIGNYYYGEANIAFMTRAKQALMGYRLIVVLAVFTGSVMALPLAWSAADLFMGVMAIINLVALIMLGRLAVRVLKNYTAQRKQGLEPVFHRSDLPGVEGIEAWDGTDEVATREYWSTAGAR